jgi:hypothetical protein
MWSLEKIIQINQEAHGRLLKLNPKPKPKRRFVKKSTTKVEPFVENRVLDVKENE